MMKSLADILTFISFLIIQNIAASPTRSDNYIFYSPKLSKQFPITPLPSYMSFFKKWNLTKHTSVFGVHIIALPLVPDEKMEHAANVMAQYLDNDENGIPDNMLVLKNMLETKATLVMFNNSNDEVVKKFQNVSLKELHGFHCQDLERNETAAKGKFDESYEEILHLISDNGWALAYPKIFGISPAKPLTSVLARNMVKMIADCGYAFNGTLKWPNCTGFFHFLQPSCKFNCMQTEYFYAMLTSILGAQDGPLAPKGRCKWVSRVWELCNEKLIKEHNPDGYALFTNKEYRLPTKLPNGRYRPKADMGDSSQFAIGNIL